MSSELLMSELSGVGLRANSLLQAKLCQSAVILYNQLSHTVQININKRGYPQVSHTLHNNAPAVHLHWS